VHKCCKYCCWIWILRDNEFPAPPRLSRFCNRTFWRMNKISWKYLGFECEIQNDVIGFFINFGLYRQNELCHFECYLHICTLLLIKSADYTNKFCRSIVLTKSIKFYWPNLRQPTVSY
jgi:hypothetical protein